MSTSDPPTIPQASPRAGYLAHRAEIDAAVARVLDSGWYILGEEVTAFERAFAAYVGVGEAIGVASGTDALEIALRACGVGGGDVVFTVSHTAVATVAAIERCGALPALVDIDLMTYTISPDLLEQAVEAVLAQPPAEGARPRAVIPVHLYGHPADMPAILDVARRHDLIVIEDCSQAHGAISQGRKVGSWGDMATFSFYPTKNVGAFGDGGGVVTDDPALAERTRLLRQYGWQRRYVSDVPGLNTRLDELQAAILRVKLAHLDDGNRQRQALARIYDDLLAESGLVLPAVSEGSVHVYHQYVLRSAARDDLQGFLRQRGIGTAIHYPVPVHMQPAYEGRLAPAGSLAHTEQAAREILSLPMFPELTLDQAGQVAEAIQAWAAERHAQEV